MDDLERRRLPPVLGDEHDFERRVQGNDHLRAIATWIEHELHASRITIEDALRLGVYAVNRYMMRHHVPVAVRVEDARGRASARRETRPCITCGSGPDDPAHDPAYAGGTHAYTVKVSGL